MNVQEFLRMRQDMLPDDSRPEIIRTYAEMRATVSEIISGSLGSVLLLGMPGNGKTTLFEGVEQKHLADGIEPPLSILNNYVTAAGLFQWAKANRGKLLLLDDVREIFRQKQNIATLMALADTKPVKRVSYGTYHMAKSKGAESFETTSNVVIVNNTLDAVKRSLDALSDRVRLIVFDPPVSEGHGQWARTWADAEVWEFIGKHLDHMPYFSGRWYFKAAQEKTAGRDWRKWLFDVWYANNPPLGLFVEVQRRSELKTAGMKIEEFQRLGLERGLPHSRATYFGYAKQYPNLRGPVQEARGKKCRAT